jgi:hypothetical protein
MIANSISSDSKNPQDTVRNHPLDDEPESAQNARIQALLCPIFKKNHLSNPFLENSENPPKKRSLGNLSSSTGSQIPQTPPSKKQKTSVQPISQPSSSEKPSSKTSNHPEPRKNCDIFKGLISIIRSNPVNGLGQLKILSTEQITNMLQNIVAPNASSELNQKSINDLKQMMDAINQNSTTVALGQEKISLINSKLQELLLKNLTQSIKTTGTCKIHSKLLRNDIQFFDDKDEDLTPILENPQNILQILSALHSEYAHPELFTDPLITKLDLCSKIINKTDGNQEILKKALDHLQELHRKVRQSERKNIDKNKILEQISESQKKLSGEIKNTNSNPPQYSMSDVRDACGKTLTKPENFCAVFDQLSPALRSASISEEDLAILRLLPIENMLQRVPHYPNTSNSGTIDLDILQTQKLIENLKQIITNLGKIRQNSMIETLENKISIINSKRQELLFENLKNSIRKTGTKSSLSREFIQFFDDKDEDLIPILEKPQKILEILSMLASGTAHPALFEDDLIKKLNLCDKIIEKAKGDRQMLDTALRNLTDLRKKVRTAAITRITLEKKEEILKQISDEQEKLSNAIRNIKL